eukprot:TRINITY_DN22381_c0_g1_i2.p1 TRINITY_DN22381_c0_g1~~TRINITY_DN22381_c0_g1_i2.p1  ORF type:complete len:274 (+),score=46.75 TRINITY_DN22381_c0_g1_i2:164-985(+)
MASLANLQPPMSRLATMREPWLQHVPAPPPTGLSPCAVDESGLLEGRVAARRQQQFRRLSVSSGAGLASAAFLLASTASSARRCSQSRGRSRGQAAIALRAADANGAEGAADGQQGSLSERLKEAVAKEDYEEAAKLRDEISGIRIDTEFAVLNANREFYEAFGEGDLDRMRGLWLDKEHTCCVHPGQAPIYTYKTVIDSWQDIFSRWGAGVRIDCRQPRVSVTGNTARVMCVEKLDDSPAVLVAINLFESTPEGWKMWHHQAGPADPRQFST